MRTPAVQPSSRANTSERESNPEWKPEPAIPPTAEHGVPCHWADSIFLRNHPCMAQRPAFRQRRGGSVPPASGWPHPDARRHSLAASRTLARKPQPEWPGQAEGFSQCGASMRQNYGLHRRRAMIFCHVGERHARRVRKLSGRLHLGAVVHKGFDARGNSLSKLGHWLSCRGPAVKHTGCASNVEWNSSCCR